MSTKRETYKTGNLEVSKDPDTGELYIELPQRMLDRLGLKPDDEIVWIENQDGSWQIKKLHIRRRKMNDEDEKKWKYSYDIALWDDLAKEEISDITLGDWKRGLVSDYDEDSPEIDEIKNRLATIEKRLAIVVPNKKLLKKYTVLQDLYSQYKAAEALLDGPDPESVA